MGILLCFFDSYFLIFKSWVWEADCMQQYIILSSDHVLLLELWPDKEILDLEICKSCDLYIVMYICIIHLDDVFCMAA